MVLKVKAEPRGGSIIRSDQGGDNDGMTVRMSTDSVSCEGFRQECAVTRDELRYSAKDDRRSCEIRIEVISAFVLRGGTRLNLPIISGNTGRCSPPPNNSPGKECSRVTLQKMV